MIHQSPPQQQEVHYEVLESQLQERLDEEEQLQQDCSMVVQQQQQQVDKEMPEEEEESSQPIQQIVDEIRRKEVQLAQKENVEPSTSQVMDVKKVFTGKSRQPRSSTPKILYEIQSQDGFSFKSTSATEVWEKVFESVQVARKAHGLKAVPDGPLSEIGGLSMLGLRTNAIRYLVEQLPGAEKCQRYSFKYFKNRPQDLDSHATVSEFEDFKENKHEVARCIPYASRSEYDMFSWLASRHRKQPTPVVIQNNDEITIPR